MGTHDLDSEATGSLSAPLSTALQGNSHPGLLPALVSAEMASRGLYSLAGGLIGHTPLSLAIIRGHDQSCDMLIRVAIWFRYQSQQKSESFAEATTTAATEATRGEWKPLGSVEGLVEVWVDNVIQTSARNHDVEAWMMYTRGSHSQSGQQLAIFEAVEVIEEGSSGLFWVGWGTAAAEPQTSAASSCFSSKQQGVKVSLGHKRRRISDLVSPRSQSSDDYGELRMHPSSLLQTQQSLLGSSASGKLTLSPGSAGQHLCRSMLASSFIICSKDGNKQQPGQERSTPFAPKTSKGDVLGILYNRMCNTISVTHNRKFIGVAVSNLIGFRGLGFVHHNPMMHNRGATSPNGVSCHADGDDGWSCRMTGCPSSWSEQSSCSSLPSTMSTRSMNPPSTPTSMSSSDAQPSALCPVIGLMSGSASLHFLSHDDSLFFKNMDSQLLREEQLHNPYYQDPLRSSPWQ
ncbi:hypothetical protein CEUSTIGMA_g10909.t1 [Chlamydomonas eustigma]|uniref:Uncharacterized protein n=1 Tax=Chlamydomonas eustigma TaxID=1157962 RepID=A0A250XK84_9CHLO|nr:hypothetical protein CEUSTIGMA_g10909.t1 [Chlamydomonas eustigma]|eukprot:GAX83484.1 hypothetical protein CEUSTIGMA_g10909.t1 [Chlamydomonas eustigma]